MITTGQKKQKLTVWRQEMTPKPKVQISCIQGYDALLLSNRWLQETEKNSTTAEKAEL